MLLISDKLLGLVRAAKRPVQLLWAAPVTLSCFLVYIAPAWALGWYRLLGTTGNAYVFVTNPEKMPKWLAKLWEPWAGQCCGNCVVLKNAPGSSPHATVTLVHELIHVRQVMTWGILQPIMYMMSSLAEAMAGEDHYRQNAFERAARRGAGQTLE